MGVEFWNVGSILFGLVALGLPVAAWFGREKRRLVFTAGSLAALAASLLFQLYERDRRVEMQDWSALMDTSDAATTVALTLLLIVLGLNLVTVLRAVFSKK